MAKSARDKKKSPAKKAPPAVTSEPLSNRLQMGSQSAVPVRTLIFMEVGNITPDEVRAAVSNVTARHQGALHPTFVLPVRDGKLTGDVLFESEILDLVNKLCEVKGGVICLRDGAREVDVLRGRL